MRIWVDDVRPAPEGYALCQSVNEAIETIKLAESFCFYNPTTKEERRVIIELIDCDHDAGEFAFDGGDYINLLCWLEETGRNYPIRLHSMNPVGVENMRRIIQHNGWTEVK